MLSSSLVVLPSSVPASASDDELVVAVSGSPELLVDEADGSALELLDVDELAGDDALELEPLESSEVEDDAGSVKHAEASATVRRVGRRMLQW